MYNFRLSIGDWSGDGHGENEEFVVSSNFPVERVREAHFKIKDVTGIDIENICSEYEEDEIPMCIVEELKTMGFQFENSTGMGEGILSVSEMARLWLFLLQKADDELRLAITEDEVPTLHFYGFDSNKRHIGYVGYGLFR